MCKSDTREEAFIEALGGGVREALDCIAPTPPTHPPRSPTEPPRQTPLSCSFSFNLTSIEFLHHQFSLCLSIRKLFLS